MLPAPQWSHKRDLVHVPTTSSFAETKKTVLPTCGSLVSLLRIEKKKKTIFCMHVLKIRKKMVIFELFQFII